MIANLLSDLEIFNVTIKLSIILYVFIGAASFSFIIFLLNLFLRKNKFKKNFSTKDEELNKAKEINKQKNDIDLEIKSIIKNRKGNYTDEQ